MSFREYKRRKGGNCSHKLPPKTPVSMRLNIRGTATLSCAALTALGNPDYIRLFFAERAGQMMIKPSRKHDNALRLSATGIFSITGFVNQFDIKHPSLSGYIWDREPMEIPLMVSGGNHTALITA